MKHIESYQLFESKNIIVYHATDGKYIKNILKIGLDSSKGKKRWKNNKYPAGIYVFTDKDIAIRYAVLNCDDGEVLQINAAGLKLKKDPESTEGSEFEDANSFYITDKIEPSRIKKIDVSDTVKDEIYREFESIVNSEKLNISESINRPVISYDFDGTLHSGVYHGTVHPLADPDLWTPKQSMIDSLINDAKDHDIYIVTARTGDINGNNPWVTNFVKEHKLPVKQIICTDDRPKLPYLKKINSIKHYDDNPDLVRQLKGSGIQLVLVNPLNDTTTVYESESHIEEKKTIKVWYHGTDQKFPKFDLSKLKEGPSKFGFWFTDDKDFAGMFGSNVLETKLKYENPMIMSMDDWDEIRLEHAKDSQYFEEYRKKLISQGHDALFVEERFTKFGSQNVRDPNLIAVFSDDQIELKINESIDVPKEAGRGSLILILGPIKDGKRALYANHIERVQLYDRRKTSPGAKGSTKIEPAQPSRTVIMGPDFFRIMKEDNKLVAKKIGYNGEAGLMKMLGQKKPGNSVTLNDSRTPIHWLTLKYSHMPKMLSELGLEIMKIPDLAI